MVQPSAVDRANSSANSSDPNQTFLRAARSGNTERVRDALDNGIRIDTCNANGLNALHLASKEGHAALVRELLHRGADPNAKTKKGNSALHIASLAGQLEVVKQLVSKGANVDSQSQNGFTPLYMAAQENHVEVVQYLLAAGASPTIATTDGYTPLDVALQQAHHRVVAILHEKTSRSRASMPALHVAAKKDDVRSIALLLTSNYDANQTSTSNFTPLHIAAHYGSANAANLLIEKGANVNVQARNNITPLHVASKWGMLPVVQRLVENQAVVNCNTSDNLTPLHCAARSGKAEVVDYLVNHGAMLDMASRSGLRPLHMATQGDNVECARILLMHGANIDDITIDQLTPLHVAAHCGYVSVAKLLLDRNCMVNARALNGFTPLHIACKKDRIKVIELLLRYHSSVDATTQSGLTPLHVAAFMGKTTVVNMLLQHGADPNTPTVRSETPLHLAVRSNQPDTVRALLKGGSQVDARAKDNQAPIHLASRLGSCDIIQLLMQHGADVDAVCKDNYTSLHVAAREGHEDVTKLLLDNKAKLDVKTRKGATPLHNAAKYDKAGVARLLLQRGADPNAKGRNSLTPLHLAAHYNRAAVATALLQGKADVNCTASNGYTPLHIAARKNHKKFAELLLKNGAKCRAESKSGYAPLHLAAQEGHAEMCNLLLNNKASVDQAASNGVTPLHLAAQTDAVASAEVLVVQHGGQIDPKTKSGYTPLHNACYFKRANMVRFLLQHGASVNAQTQMQFTALHIATQQGVLEIVTILLAANADPNVRNQRNWTAAHIAKKQNYHDIFRVLCQVTTTVENWEEEIITEEIIEITKPDTMADQNMSGDSDEDGGTPRLRTKRKQQGQEDSNTLRTLGSESNDSVFDERRHPVTLLRSDSYNKYSVSADYLKDEMEYTTAKLDDGRQSALASGSFRSNRSAGDGGSVDETSQDIKRIGTLASQGGDASIEPIEASSYSAQYREPDVFTPPENYITGKDNVQLERIPVTSGFLVAFLVDARGGSMNGTRCNGLRIVVPPNAATGPTRVTCRLMRPGRVARPPQLNDGEGLACRIIEMGPSNARFNSNVLLEIPHFASLRGSEREIVVYKSDTGETWKEHTIEASEQAVLNAVGSHFGPLESNEELRGKRVVRILTDSFPQYFALVTRMKQDSELIGQEGGTISSKVVAQVQSVFPSGALTKKIRVAIQAQPVANEMVGKLLGQRVSVSPVVTIEPRRRKFHKPITLTIPLPKPATRGVSSPGESPTLRLLCSITGGTQPATWEDITGSTPLSYIKDCVSFTTTVSARFWLMDCPNTGESADMAARLYRDAFAVPYMGRFAIFGKRHEPDEAKLRCLCVTDDKMDKTLECSEGFSNMALSAQFEVLDGKQQWIEGVGNLQPITKTTADQLSLPFRAFRENRVAFNVKVKDQTQPAIGKIAFFRDSRPTKPTESPTPICTLEIALPDFEPGADYQPPASLPDQPELLNFASDNIARSELDLRDIADCIAADWPMLARELGVSQSEITNVRVNFRDEKDRGFAMLCHWQRERAEQATGNELERCLRRIGREDVVKKCMRNVEYVMEESERQQAKSLIDQGGDLQQQGDDEQSPAATPAPAPADGSDEEIIVAAADDSKPAPRKKSDSEVAEEKKAKTEAFLNLIDTMEQLAPEPDVRLPEREEDEHREAVQEEEIPVAKRSSPQPQPQMQAEAVEDLLSKLDSLPDQSMAPEADTPDEELDVQRPETAGVAESAPQMQQQQQEEAKEEEEVDAGIEEEARQFVEDCLTADDNDAANAAADDNNDNNNADLNAEEQQTNNNNNDNDNDNEVANDDNNEDAASAAAAAAAFNDDNNTSPDATTPEGEQPAAADAAAAAAAGAGNKKKRRNQKKKNKNN